jgi:peroxiredoxin
VIGAGDTVPDAGVWITTRTKVTTSRLAEKGPYFLLFYFADWTGT